MLTFEQLDKIAGKKVDRANAKSVIVALTKFGNVAGLNRPHRLVQFLAQVMHENGRFTYDREVWGPTPAQKRYDMRTDLGNTPQADGDGKLYLGRTGIQITGKANVRAFRDWCRANIDKNCPDFVDEPDLMNTDPWEGLGPIWYWSSRNLNRYADQGDVEMVTKRVNGGLNGYDDRLELLARASLVLLGKNPNSVENFQLEVGLIADGIAGPKTRAALHKALVELTPGAKAAPETKVAPVTETVAVTPPALDKPVEKTGGFWERVGSIVTAGGGLGALLFGDWRVTAVALGGVVVISILGLVFHARIIAAVRSIKAGVEA